MGIKEHLTEPWGILTAGVIGGLGGAVAAASADLAAAVPLAVTIGGMVYAIRVVAGVVLDRPRRVPALRLPDRPELPRGGEPDRWLRRAEGAVAALRQRIAGGTDPALAARVADVDQQAAGALVDLYRLGGHLLLVHRALDRIDRPGLVAERRLLTDALRGTPAGRLREERERALRAVADQVEVHTRLAGTAETLAAQMQSSALALEGLAARLDELVTLHATSDGGLAAAPRVRELTDELEGMRAGLAETEALSRRLLASD